MKAAKRRRLIAEIKYLRGPEPTVTESHIALGESLVKALQTGETVLIPRPKLNRIHQLHLLNGRVVYGSVRPHQRAPLTVTIDEFTDDLVTAPYEGMAS